jgi:ketosteroid isomerase-like protein
VGFDGAVSADTVRRYLDGLNRADPDAVVAEVSADFVNEHTSDAARGVVGSEPYRQRLEEFLADFVGLRYESEDFLVDGNRIAVPYRMSARWRDADGSLRPFSLRGIFVFTLRDGRICRRVDYWDGMSFARQVGLVQAEPA